MKVPVHARLVYVDSPDADFLGHHDLEFMSDVVKAVENGSTQVYFDPDNPSAGLNDLVLVSHGLILNYAEDRERRGKDAVRYELVFDYPETAEPSDPVQDAKPALNPDAKNPELSSSAWFLFVERAKVGDKVDVTYIDSLLGPDKGKLVSIDTDHFVFVVEGTPLTVYANEVSTLTLTEH